MSKKPIFIESDFVEYRSDHNVYQAGDFSYWYVPRKEVMCMECIGKGYDYQYAEDGVTREKEECFNCDGTGRVEHEEFENALNQDEYDSEVKQKRYLEKRYGYLPKSISDYWERQK